MTDTVNVLGICGSLRKASINRAVLQAAIEEAPEGVSVTVAEIGDIPLYNEDVREQGYPEPVARFRKQIADANAILFVSPEYNYSMSGVLKNAIDWASRPPEPPFAGKAAAIMGASAGMGGTGMAQFHLRQSAVFLDLKLLNKPEVRIPLGGEKLDDAGKLTDPDTRKRISQMMAALADWTRKLRG